MGVPHGGVSSVIGHVRETAQKDRGDSRSLSCKVVLPKPAGAQIEMSLSVLAYDIKRAINILGVPKMMAALE